MAELVVGAVPGLGSRIRAALVRRGRSLWATLAVPRLRAGGPIPFLGRDVRIIIQAGGAFIRGDRVILADGVRVYTQGRLHIGAGTYIGRDSQVSVFSSVNIGDNVRLGERVSIHDENHVFEPIPVADGLRSSYSTQPIVIGDRVWIGANAVILPGSSVGSDTVISAGAIVRGVIPAGVLAAGVPARVVRELRHQVHVDD